MNQIIDWRERGNLVRFYLGENGKQWGDDWDDSPYEHNAGGVYSEFIQGYKDVCFPFDVQLIWACDGYYNFPYSKQNFVDRKIPFLIVLENHDWLSDEGYITSFENWKNKTGEGLRKFYFGDVIE